MVQDDMKEAADLFGNYRLPVKGRRITERGELLRYFCEQLNPSRIKDGYAPLEEARVSHILRFMPSNRDLYWLKSICEDARNRGYSFSKRFWYYANLQLSAQSIHDKGLV